MRTKKMLVSAVLLVLCLSMGGAVFGNMLSNVVGGGDKGSSGGSSQLGAILDAQKELSTKYLESTVDLASSLEKAAGALNVKEKVAGQIATINGLKSGNLNNSGVNKVQKASENTVAVLKKAMDETTAPSAESKKLMAESMTIMAGSLAKKAIIAKTAVDVNSKAKGALNGASVTDLPKIKDVVSTSAVLGTALPLDIKLEKDILSTQVAYAKTHGIKVPGDASKLLK